MKFILIILFIFFSNSIFANDENNNEVEVINLHDSKSLDQMVLDNLKVEEKIEVEVSSETEVIENSEVEEKEIEIKKDIFIYKSETNDLKNYFDKLQKINSKTLQKEMIKVLENVQFNLEINQDREIFFLLLNYLNSIGHINKAYEIIQKYELPNDQNFDFYTGIKINYLLSTFQLNEACNFKDDLNSNIKLEYFFLEKLDIFCLILQDNQSEASLLNSILLDSENNPDNYYQHLFSLLTNTSDQLVVDKEINNKDINFNLIFLYSAMTRIAELPFSDEFYNLDKKNLSIPIILNQSSPIDLRIKAANQSFLDNLITVDSLAALYMSADFNSEQLNNSMNTLDSFSNNIQLSMAFLYQLVNIQIFPNDRLNILIQFWEFAKKNNLEEIAYKLSNNMLSSIEVTSENIVFAPQIATAYIFNDNYESAISWLDLYENAKQIDSKSVYTRVLLDLYFSNNLDSFISSINITLNKYIEDEENKNEELLFVLKSVMNLDLTFNTNINLDKLFDDRSMPSIFLFNEINNSILNDNSEKFLFYSLLSLEGKEWNNIHPEHLKLLLKGYLLYNNGELFRDLVLEVFKSYNFII